jgi:hypothetical protein
MTPTMTPQMQMPGTGAPMPGGAPMPVPSKQE